MADGTDAQDQPVDLIGDAYVTLTAPFYAAGDPLEPQAEYTLPGGDDLDGTGALVRSWISLGPLLQGSLTYEQPSVGLLTCLVGGEAWRDDIQFRLNELLASRTGGSIFDGVDVTGMFFPDGYGSVAVTLHVAKGWDPSHRAATLAAVGIDGREVLAAGLRSMLLAPIQRMLRRCGPEEAAASLPYFNLTYAGSTKHPAPGRSTLNDDLRVLVYPDSPMPLTSCSPWRNQFLFAGHAYSLLAMPHPRPSVEKLSLLLLILSVFYARLARTAEAGAESLRNRRHDANVAWLAQLERRLRYEHQSLVTPTFSYDYHALLLRDAVLRAWDSAGLQSRAENMLAMVRQSVELGLAGEQARRIRRVNLVVTVLTILSAIATAEAAVSLVDRLFG